MKPRLLIFITLLSAITFISWQALFPNWIIEKHKDFNLFYTSSDTQEIKIYAMLVENGVSSTKAFFNSGFKKQFEVYVHPNRHSLDSTWQKIWNMPDAKSQCWMVASGVATRLDMIAPARWDAEACEHKFSEKKKTQKLITHEIFHVYHGQMNVSSDFSNVEEMEWFVEGLATYASGQCDSLRISQVKKAISDNTAPTKLDDFFTGKLGYGLSGSVVKYIDYKYGRLKLIALLPFNKKTEILSKLKTTESELLAGWKDYIIKL